MDDIRNDLEEIVLSTGGDIDNQGDMKKAFSDWCLSDYLTGNWQADDPVTVDGGVGSGGIGGGSL